MRGVYMRKIEKRKNGSTRIDILIILVALAVIIYSMFGMKYNYNSIRNENADLREEIYELNNKNNDLTSTLELIVKENDEMSEEKSELINEIEELKKVVDELSESQSSPSPVSRGSVDRNILAKIIHAEAKGESMNGKIAVGNVVLNRVKSDGFPNTIQEVIYQPGQFDPVRSGSINQTPCDDSLNAAKMVLNGDRVVNRDVLYFYNPETATSDWIFTRKVVTTIGNHAFAK